MNAVLPVDEGLAVVARKRESEAWKRIGELDCALAELPQQQMPLDHLFTKGMYIRQIFMPAGTLLTTRIHLTEHPFAIMSGTVSIWDDERGSVTLEAPFIGVTKAGTRRVLFVHVDCIFATFHATTETDPEKLVDLLTYNPMDLGHMDGIDTEKLAAVMANAKPKKELQ